MDLARAPRRAPLTARKKGSGYENAPRPSQPRTQGFCAYCSQKPSFSYPEPILRAVNGARQGALAKSISNWHLIGHNEGCCSNTGYILLPCFYGIRLWIWPEPLVAPRVRRALGTRMRSPGIILVPRALLTRGQRSATRGSGQIHIKLASDWLQRRLLF